MGFIYSVLRLDEWSDTLIQRWTERLVKSSVIGLFLSKTVKIYVHHYTTLQLFIVYYCLIVYRTRTKAHFSNMNAKSSLDV